MPAGMVPLPRVGKAASMWVPPRPSRLLLAAYIAAVCAVAGIVPCGALELNVNGAGVKDVAEFAATHICEDKVDARNCFLNSVLKAERTVANGYLYRLHLQTIDHRHLREWIVFVEKDMAEHMTLLRAKRHGKPQVRPDLRQRLKESEPTPAAHDEL